MEGEKGLERRQTTTATQERTKFGINSHAIRHVDVRLQVAMNLSFVVSEQLARVQKKSSPLGDLCAMRSLKLELVEWDRLCPTPHGDAFYITVKYSVFPLTSPQGGSITTSTSVTHAPFLPIVFLCISPSQDLRMIPPVHSSIGRADGVSFFSTPFCYPSR